MDYNSFLIFTASDRVAGKSRQFLTGDKVTCLNYFLMFELSSLQKNIEENTFLKEVSNMKYIWAFWLLYSVFVFFWL